MNAAEVKGLIDERKAELFTGSLEKVKGAQRGEPLAMFDREGELTHWFVPFVEQEKALGFVIVSENGKLVSYGLLAPNAGVKQGIDSRFFAAPPAEMLDEIKQQFPGAKELSQAFSYDQSPQRWGWRVEIKQDQLVKIIFLTPGGWYEQRAVKPGWEGA